LEECQTSEGIKITRITHAEATALESAGRKNKYLDVFSQAEKSPITVAGLKRGQMWYLQKQAREKGFEAKIVEDKVVISKATTPKP
jgi:hypothetical protein